MKIENEGAETVQLRNRHWQITDSRGQMQEVRGAGVVGEQPVLAPGESAAASVRPAPKAPPRIIPSLSIAISVGIGFGSARSNSSRG